MRESADELRPWMEWAHAGYGIDEAQAYRWVQRTSMDRRMTMREVAELVLTDDGA